MTAAEAIEHLQTYPPNENLIVAWWEKKDFPTIKNEDWAAASEHAEDKTDWSHTHEALEQEMNHYLNY